MSSAPRRRSISFFLRSLLASFVSSPLVLVPWDWYLHFRGFRRESLDLDLSRIQRILVLRPDEIGDIVLTTPFLRELRRLFPSAWVTLVVKPSVLNLVELCPFVNEVVPFDGGGRDFIGYFFGYQRALSFAQKLLPKRFDLALVPRWDTDFYQASFLGYLSGATWRIGYSERVNEEKALLNKGFHRFFTHVLEDRTPKHEVYRSLDLLYFLKGQSLPFPWTDREEKNFPLELWWGKEEEECAERVLKEYHLLPASFLIALGPGARSPRRQWPLENYIQIGKWLRKTYSASLLLLGGPGEESLGCSIAEALGGYAINLIGQTTLRQAAALLKRCTLYIGSDAGPMHLSAGVGIPVVEISCHPQRGAPLHPNSPLRFGPWGVPSRILQPEEPLPPCSEGCTKDYPHCILNITVQQVKEAVSSLLER